MDRRQFLRWSRNALSAALMPIGGSGWAAQSPQPGLRLVVVFLRGAIDGLNVVVPHADEAYYEYRPTIAVPRPGQSGGCLDLDGRFGLHPALDGLMPLWRRRQLAFVHACGSPDPARSHFEAQAMMETGTPGRPNTASGWMNRLATELHFERAADTVAFGATAPLIVRGPAPVATFPTGAGAVRTQAVDRDPVREAFDALYRNDARLGGVWREAEQTRAKLLADAQQDMSDSAQDAPAPKGFPDDAARAARMMVADAGLRLMVFQLGGWDTHVNQGAAEGQLANHLQPLGEGLLTLQQGLGAVWDDTTVLVMSEFGRTVRENGNRGTDHGHGNAHWLLGGAVKGGRVFGDWQGLARDALHEDRDLPVTTDFRCLIDRILERQLGLSVAARARVLPGFAPDRDFVDRNVGFI